MVPARSAVVGRRNLPLCAAAVECFSFGGDALKSGLDGFNFQDYSGSVSGDVADRVPSNSIAAFSGIKLVFRARAESPLLPENLVPPLMKS